LKFLSGTGQAEQLIRTICRCRVAILANCSGKFPNSTPVQAGRLLKSLDIFQLARSLQ
jgi:hypothetical protein